MVKIIKKADKKKIDRLYKSFITILQKIVISTATYNYSSYFRIIADDVLAEIDKDSEDACIFIGKLIETDIKRYPNITDDFFSDLFKCIVEALFLNISQLLEYYSGTDNAKKINKFLTL